MVDGAARPHRQRPHSYRSLSALSGVVTLALALAMVLVLSPLLTQIEGAGGELSSYFSENMGPAMNVVGGIVASYRVLDTLGETLVLLVSVSGATLVLKELRKEMGITIRGGGFHSDSHSHTNLRTAATVLSPLLGFIGLYFLVTSTETHGGGFQAGAVIAASIILVLVTHGTANLEKLEQWSEFDLAASLLFLLLGIIPAIYGISPFSDIFGGLFEWPLWILIFINTIITIKVAISLSLLFLHLIALSNGGG